MPGRSALVGRYAEASLGGTLIALLFDWKVTFTGKTVDLTAHLDTWEYIVPLPSGWNFTARGYIVPASVNHYLHTLWSKTVLPVYVTVAGFSGSVASGTKIFEGAGLPIKGEISAPMEMAVQDWEIKGHGAPTVGAT
jgi:hypothetical protein